jgi:hypothetical protein
VTASGTNLKMAIRYNTTTTNERNDVEERGYTGDDEKEGIAEKEVRRQQRAMRRLLSDWVMGASEEDDEEYNTPFLVASYKKKVVQRKLTNQEKTDRRFNKATLKKFPWWEEVCDYTDVSSGEEEDVIHANNKLRRRLALNKKLEREIEIECRNLNKKPEREIEIERRKLRKLAYRRRDCVEFSGRN